MAVIDLSKQPAVNPKSPGTPLSCEKCGCPYFDVVHVVIKHDAIANASTKDTYSYVATFACTKCGHVNAELDPLENE